MKNRAINFRIPAELDAALRWRAAIERRTLGNYCCLILSEFMESKGFLRSSPILMRVNEATDGGAAAGRGAIPPQDGALPAASSSDIENEELAGAPHCAAIDAVGDSLMDSLDLDRDARKASLTALDIDGESAASDCGIELAMKPLAYVPTPGRGAAAYIESPAPIQFLPRITGIELPPLPSSPAAHAGDGAGTPSPACTNCSPESPAW
jgi:hypothetical protein